MRTEAASGAGVENIKQGKGRRSMSRGNDSLQRATVLTTGELDLEKQGWARPILLCVHDLPAVLLFKERLGHLVARQEESSYLWSGWVLFPAKGSHEIHFGQCRGLAGRIREPVVFRGGCS